MTAWHYQNKVVVITGGSSGIGLALAHEFAKHHADIALIARNEERLRAAREKIQQSGAPSCSIHSCDVADESAVRQAIEGIGSAMGRIDVLICCAGISTYGKYADQKVEDLERCLRVNYLGAVYASKAAWPFLKKSGGQLSFVSSVAGYVGLIGYSSYAPTKFALTGLAECLRYEGKDEGIQVSVIFPPDTETPMLEEERQKTLPECIALSGNIKPRSAESVAASYVRGLQQGRPKIYCDNSSRLLRMFKNNFPGLFWKMSNDVIRKARRGVR